MLYSPGTVRTGSTDTATARAARNALRTRKMEKLAEGGNRTRCLGSMLRVQRPDASGPAKGGKHCCKGNDYLTLV